MPDALAAAVVALLPEASPTIVRRVLRLLLDADDAPAPAPNPVATPAGTLPTTARASPHRKRPPAADQRPADPVWEELRQQVRSAMKAQGVTYEQLATALGRSVVTLRISMQQRAAASGPLQAGLRAWLESSSPTPEVAPPAAPFRGRAPGEAGHAADRRGSGNGSTAAGILAASTA